MTKMVEGDYFQATQDAWQQVIHYYEKRGIFRAGQRMTKDIYAPKGKPQSIPLSTDN